MFKRASCAAVVMLFTNAIVFGNDDAIKEWLEKQPIKVGEKIEDRGEGFFSAKGNTLMHLAAKDGRVDVMKWLKEQGEDINAENNDEMTPIHYAACGHRFFEIQRLFEIFEMDIEPEQLNIKLKEVQINLMARDRNLEAMKWLYEQGADIGDDDGYIPIVYAAWGGNIETIKWLKEQGADINASCIDGVTALGVTFMTLIGILDDIEDLLEAEAEFPELQAEDTKKIMLCLVQDIKESIKWLRDNGAVIDDGDDEEAEEIDKLLKEADQLLKDHGLIE